MYFATKHPVFSDFFPFLYPFFNYAESGNVTCGKDNKGNVARRINQCVYNRSNKPTFQTHDYYRLLSKPKTFS